MTTLETSLPDGSMIEEQILASALAGRWLGKTAHRSPVHYPPRLH